jgi:hypothetical protein
VNNVDYRIAELKCAAMRAHLAQLDLEAIGLALRGQMISAEQALELLDEVDAIRFIRRSGQ